MRQTRVILFEGIPGSGKSTIGQFIARQIAKHGISVKWWYEEETDNSLALYHDRTSLQQVVS